MFVEDLSPYFSKEQFWAPNGVLKDWVHWLKISSIESGSLIVVQYLIDDIIYH